MRSCALCRLRQEDHKLEASLGNTAKPCLNMKQNHEYSIMKRKTKSQREFNLHPCQFWKVYPDLPMSICSTAASTVTSGAATVFTKGYRLQATTLTSKES